MGRFGADIVGAWKPVAGGVWVVLPVGEGEEALEVPGEEALEVPINSPGPISGLAKERRCEDDREKPDGETNSYHRRTSIYSHSKYSPAGM